MHRTMGRPQAELKKIQVSYECTIEIYEGEEITKG